MWQTLTPMRPYCVESKAIKLQVHFLILFIYLRILTVSKLH